MCNVLILIHLSYVMCDLYVLVITFGILLVVVVFSLSWMFTHCSPY